MARYSIRIVFQACIAAAALAMSAGAVNAQLLNGGFESGTPPTPDSWTLFNTAFMSSNVVHSGTFSLQTYGPFNANFDASFARQQITVSPGQTWVLDGYLLNWSAQAMGGPDGFGLGQMKFLSSGVEIQTNETVHYGTAVPLPEDQWQHFIVIAVAPAGADTLQVNLLHVGKAGDIGSIYFDDVVLYQQTGQTNILSATSQAGVQVRWPTVSGEHSQVQSATNLGQPTVWSDFGPVWHGAGGTNQISDVLGTSQKKFYQVHEVP